MKMTASPFAIDIEKLRDGTKIELDVRESPEALDLVDLPGVTFRDDIAGRLTYSMSGHDVFIRGRLNTKACTECVRCLEDACFDLAVNVSLNFLGKSAEEDSTAFDEEIEELDVDYYEGESLDPLPQIRDSILLEIPDLPVCSEACKGLCSQCGANLNRTPCDCRTPEIEPESEAWKSKLRGIRLDS